MTRAQDLTLEWKVANKANPDSLPPLSTARSMGPAFSMRHMFGSYTRRLQDLNVDEYVAAGSEYEMTVECPSLLSTVGKPSVPAMAS